MMIMLGVFLGKYVAAGQVEVELVVYLYLWSAGSLCVGG